MCVYVEHAQFIIYFPTPAPIESNAKLTFARLRYQHQIGERRARIMSDDCDACRIATECRDILFGPLQGGHNVHDAQIAARRAGRL